MRIPKSDNGYSVDTAGNVHTRYNDHAEGQRTRTVNGANALGAQRICRDCFPLDGKAKKA
jgi:hypothetical protein